MITFTTVSEEFEIQTIILDPRTTPMMYLPGIGLTDLTQDFETLRVIFEDLFIKENPHYAAGQLQLTSPPKSFTKDEAVFRGLVWTIDDMIRTLDRDCPFLFYQYNLELIDLVQPDPTSGVTFECYVDPAGVSHDDADEDWTFTVWKKGNQFCMVQTCEDKLLFSSEREGELLIWLVENYFGRRFY